MKTLSRILTICLCSAPVFDFAAHAVVASTAGHNLTAYNPSYSNNNQWVSWTNIREDNPPTALADLGNCSAVIMRCATPKCANGGCVDSDVASAIVTGCVQSNEACTQYAENLVPYVTAQLVANSTSKLNEQRLAAESAAAAAQGANAEQTAAQIAEMQSNMQQQMAQMQQQMAQQNAQTQQQLQNALAAQQEQNAAALQNITSAANANATASNVSMNDLQQKAIDNNVASEILMRNTITGEIMTQIEDAEISLKKAKTVMQNSFDYAGCDARGNNCTGPKRIKKWRELATEFLEPYDNTIDKIYDALLTALNVGVDLTQIYAMLDNTCNSWSQYMCPGVGDDWYVEYGYTDKEENIVSAAPRVCKRDASGTVIDEATWTKNCRPCTWLGPLTESDEIYAGWLDIDKEAKENQRVVACATSALENSKIFVRHTKRKNGMGMVDIEQLDTWLHQIEPNVVKTSDDIDKNMAYCHSGDDDIDILKSSASSRSVPSAKNVRFCVESVLNSGVAPRANSELGTKESEECPYISGTYAICDTHPYNKGISKVSRNEASVREEIQEIVGLKVTVFSQQMYKQYEYLDATLRRLKTQLRKTILTTTFEMAGAGSDDSSSGGSSNKTSNQDKSVVVQGAINCSYQVDFDRFVDCISGNVQAIIRAADSTAKNDACRQLRNDLSSVESRLKAENGKDVKERFTYCEKYMNNSSKSCSAEEKKSENIKQCAIEITNVLSAAKNKRNVKSKGISLVGLLGDDN